MKRTILELQAEIHENAKNKGFWEEDNNLINFLTNDMNLPEEVNKEINRIQEQFVIPRRLMLIVSELGEALEALRKGKRAKKNEFEFSPQMVKHFETFIKDTFEDELADTVIRIFDLCAYLGINIEEHIHWKMSYNETRPRLHGKEF